MDAFTDDRFLNGRLLVRQRAEGYRAGADAMLLAAALSPTPGTRAIEAGCGAGACLLAAAWRAPGVEFLGIETQSQEAALAQANIIANGLEARARVLCADVFAWRPPATVESVFVNPPFFSDGRPPPTDAGRRTAFIDPAGTDRWIARLSDWLTGDGVLTLIQDAQLLADVLAACAGRLGSVEVAPVFPRDSAAAKRVLVRARKGGRAPLRLRRGLVLHPDVGVGFTPEAEAIFRGEAAFDWGS